MYILLADDHGLFRDSMRAWLEQLDDSFHIDTASNLADVLSALEKDRDFRLILLDLNMPGMQGAGSVQHIVGFSNSTPVIVVSANDNKHVIHACLDAGASGFVPKSYEGESILAAIRLVLSGGTFVPKGIALRDSAPTFSQKQLDILAWIAKGASNRKIATELYLAEGTVKQYVSDILNKLNVDNRTQAALVAREVLGLVS